VKKSAIGCMILLLFPALFAVRTLYVEWDTERAIKSREVLKYIYPQDEARDPRDKINVFIEERYIPWDYSTGIRYRAGIRVNYKTMEPVKRRADGYGPNEISISWITGKAKDDIHRRIAARNRFPDAQYGVHKFAEIGEVRHGLSYRPIPASNLPEDLWQRIYTRQVEGHYDLIIRCIPPIVAGIIFDPTCVMEFLITANLPKDDERRVLINVDFVSKELPNWQLIKSEVEIFLSNKIYYVERGES